MDLVVDLGNAICDLTVLRLKVEDKLPGNTWYKNELRRLQGEGQELEVRVNKFDELRSKGRLFLKIPEFEITDVARDIKLFSEGIAFLNQHLNLDIQQYEQRKRAALANAAGKVGSDGTRTPPNAVNGVRRIGGWVTPKGLPSPPAGISVPGNSKSQGGLAVGGFVTPEQNRTPAPRINTPVASPTPSSALTDSPCQCGHCARLRHMFDSPASNSSATMSNLSSPHLFNSPASSLSSLCLCPYCAPEMHPNYPYTPSVSSATGSESGYCTGYGSHASQN